MGGPAGCRRTTGSVKAEAERRAERKVCSAVKNGARFGIGETLVAGCRSLSSLFWAVSELGEVPRLQIMVKGQDVCSDAKNLLCVSQATAAGRHRDVREVYRDCEPSTRRDAVATSSPSQIKSSLH